MTTVHPKRRMRVELPARELTLDDVTELAASSGLRYELIDGTLLVMAPADVGHARRGAADARVTRVKSSTNT